VVVTLASNASLQVCPFNNNALFTNYLGDEIVNKNDHTPFLLLRVKKVCLPYVFIPNESERKTFVNDIMQVRIGEIHLQTVNSLRENIAAVFNVREGDYRGKVDEAIDQLSSTADEASTALRLTKNGSVSGTAATQTPTPLRTGRRVGDAFSFDGRKAYIIKHFNHSPLIEIRDKTLKKLTVHLTQVNGKTFPIPALAPPTLVEIEILAYNMHKPEHSIYCFSHLSWREDGTYPGNTLTEFTSPLPHPIDVSNTEICLASMSMPSIPLTSHVYVELSLTDHPARELPVDWQMSTKIISLQLNREMSKREILEYLSYTINESETYSNMCAALLNHTPQMSQLYIQNKMESKYLTIGWNHTACAIFGFPGRERKSFTINPTSVPEEQPSVTTRRRTHRRQIVGPMAGSKVSHLFAPDLALLYCDLIQAAPVGDTMAQLLYMVPLSFFKKEKNHLNSVKLYAPASINYRMVDRSRISNISFKLLRIDGSPIVLPHMINETMKNSGGTVIELKIRQKEDIISQALTPSYKLKTTARSPPTFFDSGFRKDWRRVLEGGEK